MFEVLPFIVGIFLAQIAPGPNLMAVSSIALGSGRTAGVLSAAGVATGVFVWAILFTFGVGSLLSLFPQTITAMKILGGAYLVFLGTKALYNAWRNHGQQADAAGVVIAKSRAYKTGLLVVLTNPKAALMWVAVSTFLATAELSNLQFLAVGSGVSASAMLIYGAYALLFSTGMVMRAYQRFSRIVETAFGVVFGALGAKLMVDGIKDLHA